jgi:hypothetical protein
MYRDAANVVHEMYCCTGSNWGLFQELTYTILFGIHLKDKLC